MVLVGWLVWRRRGGWGACGAGVGGIGIGLKPSACTIHSSLFGELYECARLELMFVVPVLSWCWFDSGRQVSLVDPVDPRFDILILEECICATSRKCSL